VIAEKPNRLQNDSLRATQPPTRPTWPRRSAQSKGRRLRPGSEKQNAMREFQAPARQPSAPCAWPPQDTDQASPPCRVAPLASESAVRALPARGSLNVRIGTLCAVKITGTGPPTSLESLECVGRSAPQKPPPAAARRPSPPENPAASQPPQPAPHADTTRQTSASSAEPGRSPRLFHAIRAHLLHHVGDIRPPVAHAHVHWNIAACLR
jgi:hypothetical protein